MSHRISSLCLLLVLVALSQWPSVSEAQLQSLRDFNMTRAVEILSERFRQIANDGLGIAALEKTFSNAEFAFSNFDRSQINTLLSNSTLANSINDVLDLFNDIESGLASGSTLNPADCCSANQGTNEACCYECSTSGLSSSIAGAFRDANNLIPNRTLQFASPDGALLVQPPNPPMANCSERGMDARLQTWYTSTTRVNPVEMVMVVDLFRRDRTIIRNVELYNQLKYAVSAVLKSLNANRDRIALVGVDSSPVVPRASIFSTASKTIPLCAEAVIELETFVTSFTPGREAPNYNQAFDKAFSLFSSNVTDKVLLFFTPGLGFNVPTDTIISKKIRESGGNITLSVIRLIDDGVGIFSRITAPDGRVITLASSDGATLAGRLSSLVGDYYPPNLSTLTPSRNVTYGHAINRAGGSLSITHPYFNESSLVGVFQALLPWHRLLDNFLSHLTYRPSSYVFVTNSDRRVIFHPLVPSNGQDNVHVTDVETEGVIMELLNRVNSDTVQTAAVNKSLLQHTGSRDDSAFVPRTSPSNYYCRLVSLINDDTLYLCLVLADVDVTLAMLDTINPADLYGSSSQAPIYHNLRLSTTADQTCNYFCKRSLSDRVSFQITGSGVPTTDDQTFVDGISSFISGQSSSAPSGVQSLVATEIALAASSVSSRWTNTSSEPSQYITRRHIATSSGAYLTYPAAQFDRNFVPSRTEWYQAAVARGNLLTLTSPRVDSLREGGRFAISATYAIRAPARQGSTTPSGGTRALAVVAADLTVSSMRAFVRAAVPGCEEDATTSCFIVDDLGNLVYDRDVFNNNGFDGTPRFLGEPVGSTDYYEYRGVVNDVLRRIGLLTKLQCVDFYSPDIEMRRFYRLDTSSSELVMNVGDRSYCIDYLLQNIPGTNSFLVVLKRKRDCTADFVCFCTLGINVCQNCKEFNNRLCECPCVCPDDCRPDPGNIQACPSIVTQKANLNAASSGSLANVAELNPEFCFNQQCNCRTDLNSCLADRECSWCEEESKCVHITDCCTRDEDGACCGQSPQQQRFFGYDTCSTSLGNICRNNPGAFDVTCPRSTISDDQTSIIVAVVVGVAFGIFLIIILVIFIVWYQFFRRSDVAEETSRESAFDFSKKRMESTNPMTVKEPHGHDVKSDTGSEVGNVVNSTSPTNEEQTQTNTISVEMSNGKEKEEANL